MASAAARLDGDRESSRRSGPEGRDRATDVLLRGVGRSYVRSVLILALRLRGRVQ